MDFLCFEIYACRNEVFSFKDEFFIYYYYTF